jgi:hypothetical protein
MGSYTDLSVSERVVFTTKSYPPEFNSLIFTSDDIQIFDDLDEDDETRENHILLATAQIVVDRLDVWGYSHQYMVDDFKKHVGQQLEEVQEASHEESYGSDIVELEVSFWMSADLKEYQKAITEMMSDDFKYYEVKTYRDSLKNIIAHTIFQGREMLNCLPFNSGLSALRFILSCVPPDSEVIQDYTQIYNGGWVSDNDIFHLNPIEKIIILTEGSSDIEILKRSLRLLYPHLAEFYSFFDFEGYNSQGGAGSLVNMIKSFAAAGIQNQIVAIFDNDAAARDAQFSLKNITLPSRIKILNYPHLLLAENYPTIGPTGIHSMNINGLACSIEMYLGEDVLKKDQDELLSPIQWKGYISRINAYQGEVLDKKAILERFYNKLKIAETGNTEGAWGPEWDGLKSILKLIFQSFSDSQRYLH